MAGGRRAQKRNNGLCQHFCLGESCPPTLTLMPDTSVPLCMSLMPFKLLPLCQSSEGVSLSKSMCSPLEKNCLGLQKSLSSSASISAEFTAKSYGILSSWHWAGGPGVGLGSLTPKDIPPNFYLLYVGVGPARSTSLPLLPVLMWFHL